MKKGFTLVELLGTLVILSILLIIVFASVSLIINDSKNTVYRNQINSILAGTYDWTLKHPNELPKNKGEKNYISLLKLQKNGFVDNLINPRNKEKFPIDLVIRIEYTGGNYKYDNKYSKLYGNYLYTVLLPDANKSNNELLKPNITFSSSGVTQNPDGIFVSNEQVGNEYNSYTPIVGNNVKVIEVILDKPYDQNGKYVEFIDTTKKGIYYKYIIAIDENGNSNYVIHNIIIDDNIIPTFIIDGVLVTGNDELPQDKKIIEIEKGGSEDDLKRNIDCTDNSGKCTITLNHNIDFNSVANGLEVEYIVKDPSGNTLKIKRTVNIIENS